MKIAVDQDRTTKSLGSSLMCKWDDLSKQCNLSSQLMVQAQCPTCCAHRKQKSSRRYGGQKYEEARRKLKVHSKREHCGGMESAGQ
jgi:hypothetical protein